MFFIILVAIDAIAAAVAIWFYFVGLADGSVSSFNIGLWTLLLAGIGAILGGGFWLRAKGQPVLAKLVLLVLAIPAFSAGAMILLLVIIQPNWH